ncbi:hypothetical protein BS78_06G244100 [Paspalum vaginatum]|nr:hypothetical protein BS78_06G244100 [Paspalum vaginatum]
MHVLTSSSGNLFCGWPKTIDRHGKPTDRPAHVAACFPYDLSDSTNELSATVVIALTVDSALLPTCRKVAAAFQAKLGMKAPPMTYLFSPEGFIVDFKNARLRDDTMRPELAVQVKETRFRVLPWTPTAHASDAAMFLKVRVCTERVPLHARNLEVATKLLRPATLPKKMDWTLGPKKERACFNFWAWVKDPTALVGEGTLELHLPPVDDGRPVRCRNLGPLAMRSYPVLLHLDRVIDFRPPPPAGSSNVAWPRTYAFTWSLGVRDGDAPPRSRRCVVRGTRALGIGSAIVPPVGMDGEAALARRTPPRQHGDTSTMAPLGMEDPCMRPPIGSYGATPQARDCSSRPAKGKEVRDGLSSKPEMAIAPNCLYEGADPHGLPEVLGALHLPTFCDLMLLEANLPASMTSKLLQEAVLLYTHSLALWAFNNMTTEPVDLPSGPSNASWAFRGPSPTMRNQDGTGDCLSLDSKIANATIPHGLLDSPPHRDLPHLSYT